MAIFSLFTNPNPSQLLLIFIFLTLTLTSKPISSLPLQPLTKNPNFDSPISLFGDAKISNGGSSIQLTRPISSSSGLIMHTNPFKFFESNPSNPTSFSTDFTFSISPHNGDGIALVFVPNNFTHNFSGTNSFGLSRESRFLGIEFDTSMDGSVGDLNANHVGVDVSSLVSARVSNVSSVDLVLNSGVKLQSWVDYDASSKRLEVRLSKAGNARPYEPLLVYQIDMLQMWKEEEVLIGLSSTSGNSIQSCSVYSWSFRTRTVPKWMHSHPVNPQLHSNEIGEKKIVHKKGFCVFGILLGLAFGIGCGALAGLVMMFLRAIFVNRDEVIKEAAYAFPVGFRYEKVNVVVENSLDDVKKVGV